MHALGCVRNGIQIEHGYCLLCCGLVESVRDWLTGCISVREQKNGKINALLLVASSVEWLEQRLDRRQGVASHVRTCFRRSGV